ncbi:hypothetical protein KOI40_02065 [Aestuariicella sp. G3-2]|uniref:hypothetical protein n=1 Tax=Pseudomaricurvus albidus TaxID=2842452 RepID=UPI001C0B4DAC|nr:hypothetical protein [Aestuariicella albida]MBU3068583.1 hypothetical protein [Aestuariicella albida]
MRTVPQSSLVARVLSVAFFLLLTVAAFFWFVVSITELISQIHQNAPVIEFDKGAVTMLEIGLGLLLLTVGGMIQGLFGKDLTPKYESLFTKGIVVSILLVFLLPHAVHYGVSQYTQTTLCSL